MKFILIVYIFTYANTLHKITMYEDTLHDCYKVQAVFHKLSEVKIKNERAHVRRLYRHGTDRTTTYFIIGCKEDE